jgi:signal transduction histidine kinase
MTMVSESGDVETFQNEPDMRGSGVREDMTDAQVEQPETLGRLTDRVAHDINNLMTVIISFGAFVAEDISAARLNGCAHLENAAADMEKILTAARRGAGLTGQLLSSRTPPTDTGIAR